MGTSSLRWCFLVFWPQGLKVRHTGATVLFLQSRKWNKLTSVLTRAGTASSCWETKRTNDEAGRWWPLEGDIYSWRASVYSKFLLRQNFNNCHPKVSKFSLFMINKWHPSPGGHLQMWPDRARGFWFGPPYPRARLPGDTCAAARTSRAPTSTGAAAAAAKRPDSWRRERLLQTGWGTGAAGIHTSHSTESVALCARATEHPRARGAGGPHYGWSNYKENRKKKLARARERVNSWKRGWKMLYFRKGAWAFWTTFMAFVLTDGQTFVASMFFIIIIIILNVIQIQTKLGWANIWNAHTKNEIK